MSVEIGIFKKYVAGVNIDKYAKANYLNLF